MIKSCYHCNSPIAANAHFSAQIGGSERDMCSAGCAAAAGMIDEHGLNQFYEFRSQAAVPLEELPKESFAACDRPEVMRSFIDPGEKPGIGTMRCRIDGMTCAACGWLINKGVQELPGIHSFSVNPVTAEAVVEMDTAKIRPSEILSTIAGFGFAPRPLPRSGGTADKKDNSELKRLAVAGLGFAQVMSLSAALYIGAAGAMSAQFESFLTLASLLIATPVVLYAGLPIFRNAIRDIAHRHIGMDVPVGIAIAAALGASIFNALRGSGPVYFDSATMFVFFLTVGRFLERRARYRAGRTYQAAEELIPVSTTRIREGATETIGTMEIVPGDVVLVAPGTAAPADGTLVSSRAKIDESLLTGESTALHKSAGDPMIGGSLNVGSQPIELRVTAVGGDSYIGSVSRLLESAMQRKPQSMRVAERWASRIASGLLLLSALTGIVWLAVAPDEAFRVVLAMLVVTCPCAISLAAPAAFATALSSLARQGLLLRSTEVLDRLLDIRTWLFDKTGTVTSAQLRIARTETFSDFDAQACREIAQALEAGIEHPLARAFAANQASELATQIEYHEGQGVSGRFRGLDWRLGSARFVGAADPDAGGVWLTQGETLIARFDISEQVRPSAPAAIGALRRLGMNTALVSGDSEPAVRSTADTLGIDTWHATQRPENKLALLRQLQFDGQRVAAIGDGVNDAPLLAQADVSIAMVTGAEIAKASADIVFTGDDLRIVALLKQRAVQVRRTIRQNIGWAIAYNLIGIPMAAAGLLPPWLAALGMSVSSLIVVLNGLRLGRTLQFKAPEPAPDHNVAHRLVEAS